MEPVWEMPGRMCCPCPPRIPPKPVPDVVHHELHDRQPDAGSLIVFRTVEALKQTKDLFGFRLIEADAIILNGNGALCRRVVSANLDMRTDLLL